MEMEDLMPLQAVETFVLTALQVEDALDFMLSHFVESVEARLLAIVVTVVLMPFHAVEAVDLILLQALDRTFLIVLHTFVIAVLTAEIMLVIPLIRP